MVNIVGSCNMLRAPGHPPPGAGHGLEPCALGAEAEPTDRLTSGASVCGPVTSEHAVVTTAATMALTTRSFGRIIRASPELRELARARVRDVRAPQDGVVPIQGRREEKFVGFH